ncbi:hypothetical protein AALA54_15180 [Oscillospiraceae bacterium 44-34]
MIRKKAGATPQLFSFLDKIMTRKAWIYTRKEPFIKRQYLRAVTKKSTPCDKIEHPEKNTI